MKTLISIFLLLILLILGTCNKSQEKDRNKQIKEENADKKSINTGEKTQEKKVLDKWTYRIEINKELNKCLIKFRGNQEETFMNIRRIEVYKEFDNTPFQVIEDFETLTPIINGKILFEIEDVNFDGYNDLRLVKRGSLSSLPFIYWTFNKETGKFDRNESFDIIESPQVDFYTKQIVSFSNKQRKSYTTNYYIVKENKPVLVKQELRIYKESKNWEIIVKELINGELKVVEQQNLN